MSDCDDWEDADGAGIADALPEAVIDVDLSDDDRPEPTCPHSHPLVPGARPGPAWCDGCGGRQGPGADLMSCRGCDFDLCVPCFAVGGGNGTRERYLRRRLEEAKRLARDRRSSMRKQLLDTLIGEHSTLLTCCVAHGRHEALQAVLPWTAVAWVPVLKAAGVPRRPPPRYRRPAPMPHHPRLPPAEPAAAWACSPLASQPAAEPSPPSKRRRKNSPETRRNPFSQYSKDGEEAASPEQPFGDFSECVSRVAAAVLAKVADSVHVGAPESSWATRGVPPSRVGAALASALTAAGFSARVVIGVDAPTKRWAAACALVGRDLTRAALFAALGKEEAAAEPNSPTPERRKPAWATAAAARAIAAGGAGSGDDSDSLFSFEEGTPAATPAPERRRGRPKKKRTSSSPTPAPPQTADLVVLSVDDMLAAEDRAFSGKGAAAPPHWQPSAQEAPPRDPVAAVHLAASREEEQFDTASMQTVRVMQWAEVFTPAMTWAGVDASSRSGWRAEVAALPYCFSCCPDGRVLDVTPRYTASYSAAVSTRLERVHVPAAREDDGLLNCERQVQEDGYDSDDGCTGFVRKLVAATNATTDGEVDMLQRLRFRETPPQYHRELKKHPLYVAKSLLERTEGIPPDKEPMHRVHQYELFARDDVRKLRSRMHWRRIGRTVVPGAIPARVLAVSAAQSRLRQHTAGANRHYELFGRWQTVRHHVREDALPDDGSFPIEEGPNSVKQGKDKSYWLVDGPPPKGLEHVQGNRAAVIAQRLGVYFVKALVNFRRGGGFSAPQFDGVVVKEEEAAAVRDAVADDAARSERVAKARRARAIAAKWGRIAYHLLLRERLRARYL